MGRQTGFDWHGCEHLRNLRRIVTFGSTRSLRSPLATGCSSSSWRTSAHGFQTPSTALILQAVLSSLLLLFIGRFQALFSLAIFSEWFFYALTASTIFVFRHREPSETRPYSIWGYPVLPAFFILAAAVLLVFSFADQPRNSLIGTGIILLGIPLYFLMRRRQTS